MTGRPNGRKSHLMKPFLVLLALSQTLSAANGLYTHSVTKEGKLVHQLVQEVAGNTVVQDEWYKAPGTGIDAMVVTTRGALIVAGMGIDGTLFIVSNRSALTWLASGGELSNYWTISPHLFMPIHASANKQVASGAYVHSFTWIYGTKPPVLKVTKDQIATNDGWPVYDINVLVKAPPKTQFDIFESEGFPPKVWSRVCTAVKPLGDGTNVIFERALTNSQAHSAFRARTIWPRSITGPTAGGPFQTVLGPPAFLPTPAPFEYSPVPGQPQSSGPPQPPKK